MRKTPLHLVVIAFAAVLASCANASGSVEPYDTVIDNGTVYDGSGKPGIIADVAIRDGIIIGIGEYEDANAQERVNATGLAVAPGFINVLSWATESLLVDGKSQADIRQGVTLEVMGEGWTMGPLSEPMKAEMVRQQSDIKFAVEWTTLGEYLDHLVAKGISPNVASYVGASTVRINVLGYENRAPDAEELAQMQQLVRDAMEEGALGVGSSLIYAPGNFAATSELVALTEAANEYGGG